MTSWWPSRWKRATRRATLRMRSLPPIDVPPYFWTISAIGSLEQSKSQRRVGAAEAEGVGQRRADLHRPCAVRHEVEIAFGVLVEQVCRRRRHLVAHGEHG